MSASAEECGTPRDGPVLSMMNKRLRALRKKFNRIVQIEEAREQGKAINKEQEDVLKSKPQVSVLIEEYEKLRQPLLAAVAEELAEKQKEWAAAAQNDGNTAAVVNGGNDVGVNPNDRVNANDGVSVNDGVNVNSEVNTDVSTDGRTDSEVDASVPKHHGSVEDVVQLLYFATLFDVKPEDYKSEAQTALVKEHERSSCLSYDSVVEDDPSLPLGEHDLDLLAKFGTLVLTRPASATVSHRDALQTCIEHSRRWLDNSESAINAEMNVSYAELRERFNRILSSEYLTMTAELKTVTSHVLKPEMYEHHEIVDDDQVEDVKPEAPQMENGTKGDTIPSAAGGPQENGGNGYQRRGRGPRGGGRPRGGRGYQGGGRGGGRGNRGYVNGRGGVGQYYDQPQYQQRGFYGGGNGSGNGNGNGGRRGRGYNNNSHGNGPSPSPAAAPVGAQS